MKISRQILSNAKANVEVQIKILDDDQKRALHSFTVIMAHPASYYGSDGIKDAALRAASQTLPQIKELFDQALKAGK